ncbi:hypothetical protein IWX46DRAFT_599101 [Phyllosticta citricarpa]|uniref:Secreted protein n=1 Tax=Phyllosticta citricarpa TaxID=55181 RepID=A0ABR1MEP9_9PEZI
MLISHPPQIRLFLLHITHLAICSFWELIPNSLAYLFHRPTATTMANHSTNPQPDPMPEAQFNTQDCRHCIAIHLLQ